MGELWDNNVTRGRLWIWVIDRICAELQKDSASLSLKS